MVHPDFSRCLKERGVVRAVAVVISIIGFVSLDSSVPLGADLVRGQYVCSFWTGNGKGVPLFYIGKNVPRFVA
jgi:hypothetical protein